MQSVGLTKTRAGKCIRLARNSRTRGEFMTCTEAFGNGSRIGTAKISMHVERRRTRQDRQTQQIADFNYALVVAARGAAMQQAHVCLSAASSITTKGTSSQAFAALDKSYDIGTVRLTQNELRSGGRIFRCYAAGLIPVLSFIGTRIY